MLPVKTLVVQLFGISLYGIPVVFGIPSVSAAEVAVYSGQPAFYDIPSQDLATALKAYAAVNHLQLLYETALTMDRQSVLVKGVFTPEAALQMLLSDSGLTGSRTDVDAITISLTSQRQATTAPVPVVPDDRFLGMLQTAILQALCQSDVTRPGAYRMALQVWIRPDGTIRRTTLLNSTGDAHRDAAFVRDLQDTSVGEMPPANMLQPITMTVMPHSHLDAKGCDDR
jgi:hypothetical protein